MLPEKQLLRFVMAPNYHIIPDIACVLPGDGIWMTCAEQIVTRAIETRFFETALTDAVVDPLLPERIEKLLKDYCLNLLGMAKKSGLLTAGYEKVRAAESSNQAALLIRAGDSAFHARERVAISDTATPVITLFKSDELSAIIGRQHVVHMALKEGKLTSKLKIAIKRLTNYKR